MTTIPNYFTTPINALSTIEGTWEESNGDFILISANADTEMTISLYHSQNASDIEHTDTATYATADLNTAKLYTFSNKAKYIKISLENTSVSAQATLSAYRVFLMQPEVSSVSDSNLAVLTQSAVDILSNIHTTLSSSMVVNQSNASNLHTLIHGSSSNGSIYPISVNSNGTILTTTDIQALTLPTLMAESIGNSGSVLYNGSVELRGYNIANAHSYHIMVGLYDSSSSPNQYSTPVVRIPIVGDSSSSLFLNNNLYSFSNGLAIRASGSFNINTNGIVNPELIAGTFFIN